MAPLGRQRQEGHQGWGGVKEAEGITTTTPPAAGVSAEVVEERGGEAAETTSVPQGQTPEQLRMVVRKEAAV